MGGCQNSKFPRIIKTKPNQVELIQQNLPQTTDKLKIRGKFLFLYNTQYFIIVVLRKNCDDPLENFNKMITS